MDEKYLLALTNRVAVVTGASRGIGKAIALELAKRGAKVVVNYRTHEDAALQVLEQIRESGGDGIINQADISQFDQAQALIKNCVEHFGKSTSWSIMPELLAIPSS